MEHSAHIFELLPHNFPTNRLSERQQATAASFPVRERAGCGGALQAEPATPAEPSSLHIYAGSADLSSAERRNEKQAGSRPSDAGAAHPTHTRRGPGGEQAAAGRDSHGGAPTHCLLAEARGRAPLLGATDTRSVASRWHSSPTRLGMHAPLSFAASMQMGPQLG